MTKHSYLFLRLGLAATFLAWGIDKFVHPEAWVLLASPTWIITAAGWINLAGTQVVFALAAGQVLVGISLTINIFTRFFSGLAIVGLVAMLITTSFNISYFPYFALVGGLLAVVSWPTTRPYLQ